jgi:PilZ domain.
MTRIARTAADAALPEEGLPEFVGRGMDVEVPPLRINRRGSPRRGVMLDAIAVVKTRAGQQAMARVELLDASVRGLGLASPMPIAVGAEVKLHFNGQPLPGRSGRVVRCQESVGGMYRVGLVTDALVAA